MDKEKRKEFRRKVGFLLLKGCGYVHRLPLRWIYRVGTVLGVCAFFLIRQHRRTALESLAIAFPELSLRERKKIARQYFIFMIQEFLETFYFITHERALENISIEGKEYLDEVLRHNKGVVGMTAHLGNFPLMCYKLRREGYKVNVVVRPFRDIYAGRYFEDIRTKHNIRIIYSYPREKCVSSIGRALRRNEIVLILMDQNFGSGGVWVRFFDKLAATSVGPFVFARRTGARLIPFYSVRKGEGIHRIRILPELKLKYAADKDEALLLNTITMTKIIEGWVKENPLQWSWIHKRWKSRPSERVKNKKFKVQV